ncbi:MAG: hypothetical protein HY396_00050 [Candidatus Doudnabacteria bacterium]|nr:hypothetical protein [Candidatus Doudnabacteria bacterium]
MKKAIIIVLPLLFTAQACNFLFGDITGQQGSGPRGVFVSTDSGQTWQESSIVSGDKNLGNAQVSRIIIEKANNQNLLVATLNAGVFASDNQASKWFRLLPEVSAYDAFINPHNSEEIFVAGAKAKTATIMESPDRAGSWIQIYSEPVSQAAVTSLITDPRNPAVLFAGLSTGTILRSIDFGNTWNVLTDFSDRIAALALTPTGLTFYMLGRSEGLRRSNDGGKNWAKIELPEKPTFYNAFNIDANNSAVLYIATDKGLFRSQDNGASFSKLLLPLTPELNNVSAVAVNPKDSRQIFAAIRATVYRSDDGGTTWRTSKLPTQRIVSDIAIDPAEPNRIYVGLK